MAELAAENRTSTLGRDLTASIVVFLVALPLCMGIAIASGAPVAAGLITGVIGGLVVAPLAGCPLQVSGPAAGLTVIIYEAIERFGPEMLGVVVLLAGIIQGAAALLKLGGWFRAVSPAVINGMLAGIGVLIFASQFHVMVDDKPKDSGLANLTTIPQAVAKAIAYPKMESKEVRQGEARLLVAVGELHRRQVSLLETVAERAPHHEIAIWEEHPSEAPHIELADLAEEQQSIARDATSAREQLHGFASHIDDQRQLAAMRQRFEELDVALAAASDALVEEDPAAAVHTQEAANGAFLALLASQKNHYLAAQLGMLTIAVIVLWQAFASKRFKLLPAPLLAVITATIAAAVLSLPVLFVEIPDNLLADVHYFHPTVLQDAPWAALLQTGLLIAAVASAETLLCATAVDQLHQGERTKYDRELFAQGIGNLTCGLLGALPMTGVIVRSSANVNAGGATRWSAFLHGAWLLLFVVFLAGFLRMVPTSALAAILVYTGFKLVNVKAIKELVRFGWSEVAIYAVTVATIVASDLLTGVLVGIGLAATKLFVIFSRLKTEFELSPDDAHAVLKLKGAATFVRLPLLASELERTPRGAELRVDFERLTLIDHACLNLLTSWAKQHRATGGSVIIDWESLRGRFASDGGESTDFAQTTNTK